MAGVGDVIKTNRELCGYSRKKLAELSNISDSELMKIENGDRKNPSWKNLCEIAKALDISPIEFMIETGYITQNDLNPAYMLKRVDKLEKDDLRDLQLFIDFLADQSIFIKGMADKQSGISHIALEGHAIHVQLQTNIRLRGVKADVGDHGIVQPEQCIFILPEAGFLFERG